VANDVYSVAADLLAWTNDDDAGKATAVLTWQYPSGTLNTNATVELHARRLNYAGAVDEAEPSAGYSGAYVGTFRLDNALAASTDSVAMIPIALDSIKASQEYAFYILNKTGVQISAGWKIEIMPKTVGPHA
jgi:hypothetical protein